ncbi:MAG: DUF805 domain-containing protein [Akkermansiaceae bacterium]|nr:DUF805 domain-containing protein [Akkermansiaceae bacterium]
MNAPKQWYYVDGGGQQVGPMPIEEIKGHVSNGLVTARTLVWSEGMADWLAASAVDGILSAPAPAPQQAQANLAAPLAAQSAPAQVNPYSTPQANLGMAAGIQAKPGFWAMLFSFQGRIPRRQYWGYTFLVVGIFYAIVIAASVVFGEQSNITIAIALGLYIPLIWSSMALQVKRWHDRDKSGWMYLVNFIPFVGGIWAFVECGCLRGSFGLNNYGEDPT